MSEIRAKEEEEEEGVGRVVSSVRRNSREDVEDEGTGRGTKSKIGWGNFRSEGG